jgi:hypothetical protein
VSGLSEDFAKEQNILSAVYVGVPMAVVVFPYSLQSVTKWNKLAELKLASANSKALGPLVGVVLIGVVVSVLTGAGTWADLLLLHELTTKTHASNSDGLNLIKTPFVK